VEQTGYHVVLEPDPEGGYVAIVPAFPGYYSQGETAEEALSNAREAILLTIEDMREGGDRCRAQVLSSAAGWWSPNPNDCEILLRL
jgi:predicted RNase H-like HicB family nuclease